MSKALLSLACLCGIIALANGHAQLLFPVPWLNKPATAGATACPGTNPNAGSTFTLWVGNQPGAPPAEDVALSYKNSILWKVVAGDGAGVITMALSPATGTLALAGKMLPDTLTNGPSDRTPAQGPDSKVGPYNATFAMTNDQFTTTFGATLLPTEAAPTQAIMRIGTNSWSACVNVDIKAIPADPVKNPSKPNTPPAASTAKPTTTTVAVASTKALEGCIGVWLPADAFCAGTKATGGAYVKMSGQPAEQLYFPYKIDVARVPQLVEADGVTFNPEGAQALDASLRESWEEENLNNQNFEAKTDACAEAYRRYLCADRFPVCGTSLETGGACNSACNNVMSTCKPNDIHKDYLDCANESVMGTSAGKFAFDSAGACPADSTKVSAASSVAAPVAWLFVVAAALFVL